MKPKKLNLAMATALALGMGAANADISVSGHIKNETAVFVDGGQTIGEAEHQFDNKAHHNDVLKFENSARLFVNGDLGESSSWHLDLNLIYDTEGIESEYKGHQWNTQNDWLKEAYIDTRWGDTDLRIGKQQVVWGTADGIKLLDIINPTDFREFNQNTFEDSRVPVWMLNVDHPIGETGSLQFIAAESQPNKIPGLDKDGDRGHPFTVQGVDTITGQVNGILSIGPALARVATTFADLSDDTAAGLTGYTDATVAGFVGNTGSGAGFNAFCVGDGYVGASAQCLNGYANYASATRAATAVNKNLFKTNLTTVSGTATANTVFNPSNPQSAFEYMPNATFATFSVFAGNVNNSTAGTSPTMVARYKQDHDNDDGNFGVRFKDSTESGINYSVNYLYHYDNNPYVELSYHDAVTGEQLQTELRQGNGGVLAGTVVTRDQVPNAFNGTSNHVSVMLKNGAGQYYGAFDPAAALSTATSATHSSNGVEMRLTEKMKRIHSLGGSFDMAIDRFDLPVVLRGEFLYDADTMQPVVDKRLIGIGDLEGGLTNEEQDFFKYVIGVDVTVLTNMLISTQFIQFRNLDYEDTQRTCTTESGLTYDCSKYTGDAPTLHMTNGLNKAEENKEFVSLFFTKPFGSEQQGRWGNITIFEDTGGYWNRFDVEYGLTDKWVLSGEWNAYWGDDDSWFGQLENSSNLQVGVKYIFD